MVVQLCELYRERRHHPVPTLGSVNPAPHGWLSSLQHHRPLRELRF